MLVIFQTKFTLEGAGIAWNVKTVKDDAVEWHKSKKTQIIVKNAKNIYVYCDCYPEYEKVTRNTHWVFRMWAA